MAQTTFTVSSETQPNAGIQAIDATGADAAGNTAVNPPSTAARVEASERCGSVRGISQLIAYVIGAGGLLLSAEASVHVFHGRLVDDLGAVFVASTFLSIAGFALSALGGVVLFHLISKPVHLVRVMVACSSAIQLVLLAGGAMAQDQEIARPILSAGLRDATSIQTQTTEKLGQPHPTEPQLNAANLPPIESIGAGSDIRPFLAPGVPADLTRAALRRAWSTDSAIRDFIGLSENSWDFNAQDGVPGLGSPIRQLSARMTGEAEKSDTERLVQVPTVAAVQTPSSAQVK